MTVDGGKEAAHAAVPVAPGAVPLAPEHQPVAPHPPPVVVVRSRFPPFRSAGLT